MWASPPGWLWWAVGPLGQPSLLPLSGSAGPALPHRRAGLQAAVSGTARWKVLQKYRAVMVMT